MANRRDWVVNFSGISSFLFLFLFFLCGAASALPGDTVRVSVGIAEGNGDSFASSVSADGRFVAFESIATDLVPGDTNGVQDIFVRDRQTGATVRVSVDSAGTQGNSWSYTPSINASGRFVAFYSVATNLVAGDTNGAADVFVHDRDADGNGTYDEPGGIATVRVSVSSSGSQGNGVSTDPSISADGRFVAFRSQALNLVPGDTNATYDVFVHDRDADGNGTFDEPGGISTVRVSVDSTGGQADLSSGFGTISSDGRFVAFFSDATNLVANDTNGNSDVFVHDRDADGNGTFDEPGGISTVRVSVDSAGAQGNSFSLFASISADGRYVMFQSEATNLVANDTNGFMDVFVHDRDADGNGTFDEPGGISTVRISVASDGTQGTGTSFTPNMVRSPFSADGRFATFYSSANNLVANDTNGNSDVFVHDRQTGETIRVSVNNVGSQGDSFSASPSISADGRYVVFESAATNLVPGDGNGFRDIFVHDRQAGVTTRVSVASGGAQGNNHSGSSSISADGRYVAFFSAASNLVPGDTNGQPDIFVHDRLTGTTTRVSVASGGSQANGRSMDPSISADGRYVAFWSNAPDLVPSDTNGVSDYFVNDRLTGTTTRISVASDGTEGNLQSGGNGAAATNWSSISADGRFVAFFSMASNLVPGDTNGVQDIFVHDRLTGTTTRVSVASSGSEGNGYSFVPSISADGRFVAFGSSATNLVSGDTNGQPDIFVHDRLTGMTTRVSVATGGAEGNSWSNNSSISGDGRFVAFNSNATNLLGSADTNGFSDVFVRDRLTGTTTRVSVASDGTQGNQGVFTNIPPSLSADGRYVVFSSFATNLVEGDFNGVHDAFVHDRWTGTTARVNLSSEGTEGNFAGQPPSINADGRYVAFYTLATNLVSGDTNGVQDIFVHSPEIAWYKGELFNANFEDVNRGAIVIAFANNNYGLDLFGPDFALAPGYPLSCSFPCDLPNSDSISISGQGPSPNHIAVNYYPVPNWYPTNYLTVANYWPSTDTVVEFLPDASIGPFTTGQYTVSWQSAREAGPGVGCVDRGRFELVDAGGDSAFDIIQDCDTWNVVFTSGSQLGFPPASPIIHTYGPYPLFLNGPLTYSAVVDLDAGVVSRLFINGDQVGTDYRFLDATFDDIGKFRFRIPGDATSLYEPHGIDNIKVSVGTDGDGDGTPENVDNCPLYFNPDQADVDGDGVGDACDICPTMFDPGQADSDGDWIGDACDPDADNDGVADKDAINTDWDGDPDSFGLIPVASGGDSCPTDFNPAPQVDTDGDGIYDACDNCPAVANADQRNSDEVGPGDACQASMPSGGPPNKKPNEPPPDTDGDGVADSSDNCSSVANADQTNSDGDSFGDACDTCPTLTNPDQSVPLWYKDADGDRYSDGTRQNACSQPAGYDSAANLLAAGGALSGECDDANPARNPGLPEIPNNGIDDDCNADTPDAPPAYVVVFDMPGYDSWLPGCGALPGTATVVARVVDTATNTDVPGPISYTFTLTSTNLPGQYANDESIDTSADFTMVPSGATFTLTSFDCGGSATVSTTATFGGNTAAGTFTLPKDTDRDTLPDAWENQYGGLDPNEDIETRVGNTYVGDGLTNFEEYRGFMWKRLYLSQDAGTYKTPAYLPGMDVEHIRTDPTGRKDLFVKFQGYNQDNPAVPEKFAIGSAFENAGVAVHAMEAVLVPAVGENNIDVAVVTNNLTATFQGTDGRINKRGLRDWTWDTKGASGLGDATRYGLNTTTYEIPLHCYFTDRPYRDQSPGVYNILDPIESVEDGNDNGTDDRIKGANESTRIVNNAVLDGDLFVFNDYSLQLSTFDINRNTLVELPVATTPGQIGTTTQEYPKAHVLKHTITHELGHAVGIPHTQVSTCLMYEYSPDWSRDGGFSDAAMSYIQIHNAGL